MSSPYQRFAYYTFGCKVNFADSCMIARSLTDKGLTEVSIDQDAEIYILNTCSVTEKADKKAESFIKKLYKRSPDSKIIVTGCYAQLKPQKLKNIPGVYSVINAENKFNIDSYINIDDCDHFDNDVSKVKDFNISYSINERTRAFVKVQDGCDYVCSYCTIPKARGKSRSGTIDSIILNIKNIVKSGVNEVVLSGINVGDFGKNNNESLHDLLMEIEQIDELKRYRISSIEPNLLDDLIIKLISKSQKAVPHFHIPLQSGSNKILKSMKRRYKVEDYRKLINTLHKFIPNICIGVDVIVGYPGEDDEDFIDTYNYLNEINVSYLHVFSYSDRLDTDSYKMKSKVTNQVKTYRRKLLQKLSKEKFNRFIDKNINQTRKVLFENYNEGILDGLTDNYIRVYANGNKTLINKIKDVKILANEINVNGEIIG
tara:strand:+ start:499 stop:1782 length:1284 start_codon:yes stop_codon:yes gene_type:complete